MHLHCLKKVTFAVMATTALCAAGAAHAGKNAWAAPDCRSIAGAPYITATVNEGARLAKTHGHMAPFTYTRGLVTLEQPNTLLAAVGSHILRSTDVGCTWQPLADLSSATGGALLVLEPAAGSRAYGWAVNSSALATIDGDQASSTWVPGAGLTGLGLSRVDPKQLRYGDAAGTIWTSLDGGQSWAVTGGLAGHLVYRMAFDPANPDHILMGTMVDGALTSFDGGRSWQPATGFAPGNGQVNVFNLVVSPVDPKVVWAMAIDLAEAADGAPSGGRHLYRSTDGGLHFERVVDQDRRVTLTNGPLMVPHPVDPAVLYFVFGMSYANYGTDLYRYDHNRREVTLTHNRYPEIGSIAFHPRNPKLMFLGLVND